MSMIAGFREDAFDEIPRVSPGEDRLRRIVQAALAIYLLPAVILVLLVGGGLMVVGWAAQGAASLAGAVRGGIRPGSASPGPEARRGWIRGPFAEASPRLNRRARADLAEHPRS